MIFLAGGSGLEKHLLIGILKDHPFAADASQVFADAFDTSAMDAELHQLMGDFAGLTLDLASEADDEGDDIALDLLQGSVRREKEQGKVQLIRCGDSLSAEGIQRGSRHRD